MTLNQRKIKIIYMKRKFLTIILSVFLFLSLWAKGPEKNFPYVYYDKTEKSFSSFGLSSYDKIKTVRNNDKWTVTLYRKNNTDYIVYQYKKDLPSLSSLKDTLDDSKSVWKKYDEDNGSPDVCHIFLDSSGNFILSAKYAEYQGY